MINNEVKRKHREKFDNYNKNIDYNEKDSLREKSIAFKEVSNSFANNDVYRSTIDEFLDKVGYSYFQIISIFIVCYLFFIDGCEMIIVNIILSSLQFEWKIKTVQRSLLSSAVFFGFFTGSFFSGYFMNKYGRKKPILFGSILIWVFTSLTPMTHSFTFLFMIRILVGLGIGLMVPASTSLITEIIPSYYRSFVLNILWILYPLGIIFICLISTYFIKNKEYLEWRKIAFINSYTSISMIFTSFYLCESPRFLLLKKRYKEAFEVLNKLGYSKKIQLSEEDKKKMINESIALSNHIGEKSDFNISIFLNNQYLKTTILLCYLWFISSIIAYGLLYMLPKIFDCLSKHNKLESLFHMIHAMLILFPCPLVRGWLSEMKCLGRKNSILLGFGGAFLSGICCLFGQKHIALAAGFLKFFTNVSLGIISVYTSEIYPTNVRGISLGFGNSITRLAGILTPFICELIENYIFRGTFWIFIIGSFTGVLVSYLLPYETLNMDLDTLVDDRKKENLSGD